MENNDKKIIIGLSIIVFIFIVSLVFLLPITIHKLKSRNNYEELTFDIDEFEVDFDDDKDRYDIFADGEHYYIPRKQLEIVIDTQYTYIVLLINEYDYLYNKAYLVINVKTLQEEEIEK